MARTRDSLTVDLARLDHDRTGLIEFVQNYQDRLTAERRELDANEVRVSDLQQAIARIERAQQGLAARERDVATLNERTTSLASRLASFETQEAEVEQKMETLAGL